LLDRTPATFHNSIRYGPSPPALIFLHAICTNAT
jgi:hypothetical protein